MRITKPEFVGLGGEAAERVDGSTPRNDGWRWTSCLRGRPVAKPARLALGVGLLEQEIQPAGGRILIHLLAPKSGVVLDQPPDDLPDLFGGQLRDLGFDPLDIAHDEIVQAMPEGIKIPFR